MRKVYKLILAFSLTALIVSCSEDDKLPKPVVSFSADKNILEVGVPVTFNNTTTNAVTYSWDFGNGGTSDQASPTTIYDEAGLYRVTLIATTSDNQSEELSIDVEVGERELFIISINNISFENNIGEDWDELLPDSASSKLPDVWVIIGPDSENFGDLFVISPIIPDLSQNLLSINLSIDAGSTAITTLTDEDWFMTFYDFDGPSIEDIDPNATLGDLIGMSEVMSNLEFNPVQIEESDVNGEGVIELNEGVYDVELTFKVE